MRRLRTTLFGQIALGLVVVSVVSAGACAAYLYVKFRAIDARFREDTLRSFAESLAHEARIPWSVDNSASLAPIAQRIDEAGGRFAIVSAAGAVLAASSGVSAPLGPVGEDGFRYFLLPMVAPREPMYGVSLPVRDSSPPVMVQVAFPGSPVVFDSVLEEFVGDIGWIAVPFALGLLATNLIVARYALKPLRIAAREAEAIGPHGVAVRLSGGNLPQDVHALVQAVNSALDRLQGGYRELDAFVGEVAHELRTPLAVIRAQIDVSDAPVARALGSDFAAMERLVLQLLDRVRLGGLHFEPNDKVDISEVARSAAAFMAPLAVARGRSIEVVGAERPIFVAGARDYIFRALRNLIENAIANAPLNTTVSVQVSGAPAIAVLDEGPGFPQGRFDKEARRRAAKDGEGLGLGLSIVERTMAAHDGRLVLSNRPAGGACAGMIFSHGA
ncbi:MAG: ATP-binding protein [Roseiarcus sp.]|jgi:signal transduction histidine kinase